MSIFHKIRVELNYAFYRDVQYRRKALRHLVKFYTPDAPTVGNINENEIICMADGKLLHGGLADRLRSFCTFFAFAREHGFRFGIYFRNPFRLEDYLVPNEYDWTVADNHISYNSNEAAPIYLGTTSQDGERERRFQHDITARFLARYGKMQNHIYSAYYFAEDAIAKDFKTLFKPAPRIEEMLQNEQQAMGGEYVSVSARFLELLGDFHEPVPCLTLQPDEQEQLIERCLEQLKIIHEKHPNMTVLVTADSQRFVNAAAQLPFVHVVEGKIAHVDTTDSADHTKTFLDFLLVSRAKVAYQLRTAPMYGGNFSLRAAQIGNIPFKRIQF